MEAKFQFPLMVYLNIEICVLEEFILRFFNEYPKNGKDGKKWFLTPEMAIWHKLYTVFV